MIAALLLIAASPTDQPHREWGERIALSMTMQEAQRCMARRLDQRGNVLVLPFGDGFDFDWSPGGTLLAPNKGEASMTFQLRQDQSGIYATGLYRHPFSAKMMSGMFKDLKKRCLIARDGP